MKKENKELVSNRKAFHNYEILETFEAGVLLKGTEVKSLRENGGSLQEAYVLIREGELWLVHAHIAPYRFGNLMNHEELRERKLLMHRGEIFRLKKMVQEKGMTIIPLAFYLKKGVVKAQLALAKGKKSYDKREAIQEREEKKNIQRILKKDYD